MNLRNTFLTRARTQWTTFTSWVGRQWQRAKNSIQTYISSSSRAFFWGRSKKFTPERAVPLSRTAFDYTVSPSPLEFISTVGLQGNYVSLDKAPGSQNAESSTSSYASLGASKIIITEKNEAQLKSVESLIQQVDEIERNEEVAVLQCQTIQPSSYLKPVDSRDAEEQICFDTIEDVINNDMTHIILKK